MFLMTIYFVYSAGLFFHQQRVGTIPCLSPHQVPMLAQQCLCIPHTLNVSLETYMQRKCNEKTKLGEMCEPNNVELDDRYPNHNNRRIATLQPLLHSLELSDSRMLWVCRSHILRHDDLMLMR